MSYLAQVYFHIAVADDTIPSSTNALFIWVSVISSIMNINIKATAAREFAARNQYPA
jgi:hypothetical protein